MKRMTIVAVIGLAAGVAQAADDTTGWRVGAAASFSDFEWTEGPDDPINDSAIGAKLFAQYAFSDWLAVEGAYHNTGDLEDFSLAPAPNDGNLNLQFDGLSLSAIGYLPMRTEDLRLYGKVGYYDFDAELSSASGSSTGSENGFLLGAGASLSVADNLGIRADFDWFDNDIGNLWTVNLGIEYRFGGSASGDDEPAIPPPPADAMPAPADMGEPAAPEEAGSE